MANLIVISLEGFSLEISSVQKEQLQHPYRTYLVEVEKHLPSGYHNLK